MWVQSCLGYSTIRPHDYIEFEIGIIFLVLILGTLDSIWTVVTSFAKTQYDPLVNMLLSTLVFWGFFFVFFFETHALFVQYTSYTRRHFITTGATLFSLYAGMYLIFLTKLSEILP